MHTIPFCAARRRGGGRAPPPDGLFHLDEGGFGGTLRSANALPPRSIHLQRKARALFQQRIDEHAELRLVTLADARDLHRLVDEQRAHLRAWLPWVDATRSAADTEVFLKAAVKQVADQQGFQAAIVCDGAIAGLIGFHAVSWANRSTSIGYWLAGTHEGRGLMTRACRALVEHAFVEWDLNRIEIRCATGNTRSRAIPERLGFRLEGRLREAEWLYDHFVDHAVYGLLRADWTAAR